MKIGIYINQPGAVSNNKYFLKYTNLVDFFASFSNEDRLSGIDICLPLSKVPLEDMQCLLDGYDKDKMSILGIPYYNGASDMAKKSYKILPMSFFQALKLAKRCNIIGSVMPSIVGFIFCFIAIIYKRKLFLIIRGDKVQSTMEFNGMKKHGYRSIIQSINQFIFKVCKNNLIVVLGNDLARIYGRHCKNIHIIGAQIRDELFSLSTVEWFPKNGKQITLLFVGRLDKNKNADLLIEAVAELSTRYDILLKIVGSGSEEANLKKTAKDYNLQERVLFTGHIPYGEKLFGEYQMADLFILPSLSEGIPRAILEAMSLRVPVISTRVGGIPSIVKHMITGILFDPGNVKELVQSIVLLFDNETLRKQLVRNGFDLAKEYSFSVQREKLLERIIAL